MENIDNEIDNITDEIENIYILLKRENLQPSIINNKLTVKIPFDTNTEYIYSVHLPIIFEPIEYLKIIDNIIKSKNYKTCPYCGKNTIYGYYLDKYDGWICTNYKCNFELPHKRHWSSYL